MPRVISEDLQDFMCQDRSKQLAIEKIRKTGSRETSVLWTKGLRNPGNLKRRFQKLPGRRDTRP